MQPKQTKLSLAIGAICLGMTGGAFAATENFTITVDTLPDVTINEITGLDYGTRVFTTAGAVCNMDADNPQAVDMNYDAANATDDTNANHGLLSGDCVAEVATPGL